MTLKSNQCIIIMFSTHAHYLLNRFSCVQLFVTVMKQNNNYKYTDTSWKTAVQLWNLACNDSFYDSDKLNS